MNIHTGWMLNFGNTEVTWMKKIILLLVLLFVVACGQKISASPDEIVQAFIDAYEGRDAELLVSYFTEGEISNLESAVDDIKNEGDPDRILDIMSIELSDSEIRRLDARTLYILSFESQWEVLDAWSTGGDGFIYTVGEPAVEGDTARVAVTRSDYSGEEVNTWVLAWDGNNWEIEDYHF